MNKTACIVLAAGDGKRMKSIKPKVLMEVLFKPMLGWVLDSAEKLSPDEICVVVGNGEDKIGAYLETRDGKYTVARQTVRLGTGHAVMQAENVLKNCENVLVLCGDAPFMDVKGILPYRRRGAYKGIGPPHRRLHRRSQGGGTGSQHKERPVLSQQLRPHGGYRRSSSKGCGISLP